MILPRPLHSAKVVVGGAVILFVAFAALLAPLLAPHDPNEQNLLSILTPPIWLDGGDANFPLGTDNLGRDVLSRLLFGAQSALIVASLGALGAMMIGTVLAHVAGYFGGWLDWFVGRAVDVWMSFPPVVLALILMIGLGTGLDKVILAIVLVDWTRFCRVLRSEVLVVSHRDYVAAARLVGGGRRSARCPGGAIRGSVCVAVDVGCRTGIGRSCGTRGARPRRFIRPRWRPPYRSRQRDVRIVRGIPDEVRSCRRWALRVGLGLGWNADEHRQAGIDFLASAERSRRLGEAIQLIRQHFGPWHLPILIGGAETLSAVGHRPESAMPAALPLPLTGAQPLG